MTNQEKLINNSRAIYYGLFSSLFAFTENENRFKGVKETVELLSNYPLTDEAKKALQNLKEMLSDGYDELSLEYDRIFFDPSSPIRTTASYYDEGYESGRKRVEMINYVLKTEFRRDETKYTDTEDDVGFIFSFMYHLIVNSQKNKSYTDIQKDIIKNIINGFIDEFINDLTNYSESRIFKEVCTILKSFMEFERMFFDIPPKVEEKPKKHPGKIIPYVNLKKRGRHKYSQAQICNLDEEEEETVEEDL